LIRDCTCFNFLAVARLREQFTGQRRVRERFLFTPAQVSEPCLRDSRCAAIAQRRRCWQRTASLRASEACGASRSSHALMRRA
jgi:hypothetical protein